MGNATLALVIGVLAAGAADAEKDKEKVKLSKDERALYDLLTRARAREKLRRLKLNTLLCEAARKHAENMARQEKMSHRLDGKGVGDRVTAVGYDWKSVRENLARAIGGADLPAPAPIEIHERWMKSKGHRANLLSDKVSEVGLSVVISKKGNYYYALVFAEPSKGKGPPR